MRALPAVLAALLIAAPAAAASPIEDKYDELGGDGGFLGAATSRETPAADGIGKLRHYAGGSIYWHPQTGAHVVRGKIRQEWNAKGAEGGFLGYPLSDEIDTATGGGKVSKFQRGELIGRSATNAVATVRSLDLVLDWPFPVGEAWEVIKTNGDHHGGAWAYCLDMILAGTQSERTRSLLSSGRPFTAAAEAKLAWVAEDPARPGPGNIVVQRAGEGRYVSYLHHSAGSYAKRFLGAKPGAVFFMPQASPWSARPLAKAGTQLAEIGDSGLTPRSFHMHWCVTTKPDRPEFGPFESVPVAFRNYSSSTDLGATWTFVEQGVPTLNAWIRREPAKSGQPPLNVNPTAIPIDFGSVVGTISPPPSGGKPAGAGKLTVTVSSEWGEPLRTTVVAVPASNPSGPWKYEVHNVPSYDDLTVSAAWAGPWSVLTKVGTIAGKSGPFALAPSATQTRNLVLETP